MTGSARVRVGLGMAALGAVGIFDGALGVAWPSMRLTFDQPLAALGIVIGAYTAGYFVTSLAGGWLLERVGTGNAMLGIAASAIVGATLFAVSPTWAVVLVGASVLGVSGGAADLTLNHDFAQHQSLRAIGFLHAAWGLGAAGGPALVTLFVTADRTWRWAYVPVIVLQGALLVAFLVVRRDWAPVPRRADVGDDVEPLDPIAFATAIALFFVYVGLEAGVGSWGFTLLTAARGMDDGPAGAWMSAYWLSLTAGRLLLGVAGGGRRPDAILTGSVVGAVAGCAVLWLDPAGLGELAIVPIGLSLASVFPVLVAVTPARLGVHRAARAIGMQVAASAVGGVAVPAALGIAAQWLDVDVIPALLSSWAVVFAGLHAVALSRRRVGAARR